MRIETSRRGFLGAAAGIVGLAAVDAETVIENETGGFKLGVATYSFRQFQRDLAIKMIKELKTPYVCVKEFHLPYRESPEALAEAAKNSTRPGSKW